MLKAIIFITIILLSATSYSKELHSYAHVQADGTLVIKGKEIHLHGIYLPDTGNRCEKKIRPARCGSRAFLALEFKIQGFVHCYTQNENTDGSFNAVCYVNRNSFNDGDDLAIYLLDLGWALALPDAPFEYIMHERIAKHNHRGVWGFTIDSF